MILSLIAKDKDSDFFTCRNFTTTSHIILKAMIEEWLKEITFQNIQLNCPDNFTSFNLKIREVLQNFNIKFETIL